MCCLGNMGHGHIGVSVGGGGLVVLSMSQRSAKKKAFSESQNQFFSESARISSQLASDAERAEARDAEVHPKGEASKGTDATRAAA